MHRVHGLRRFRTVHECVILTSNIKDYSLTSHMHTTRTSAYQIRICMQKGSLMINYHLRKKLEKIVRHIRMIN